TSRIPTSYESAILGRRILALSPLATLSTVFPATYNTPANEDADGGLGGVPIGLMDYIADCDPDGAAGSEGDGDGNGHRSGKLGNGNPTILAIRIATSFKNVDAGSNMSVSVNWVPPHPPSKRIESHHSSSPGCAAGCADGFLHNHDHDTVPYSAANLPRFSLLGYLEPILTTPATSTIQDLQSCFLASHPDARYWLPGNRIHTSEWVRLVVTQVYWIGGFGDRAYIGWIPVEEWHNVTREEWESVRLPGEKKGWKEWSVGS
ncbi:pyridoxamine 5'-phosphate oxidase-domain-containing protein, partial [Coniella lustricola]